MKFSLIYLTIIGLVDGENESKPGYCKNDQACQTINKNYSCVSVQTTRAATVDVKECVPNERVGDICGGITPGMCPTFAAWAPAYTAINTVCAYVIPTAKCKKEGTPSKAGAVDCMYIEDETNQQIGVIYGCVDYDTKEGRLLFEKKSKSDKLASKIQYESFLGKACSQANSTLCAGRGTCRPDQQKSTKYYCACNVGYTGSYCQKIDSNKCTNKGQCTAGFCDLNLRECRCPAGTTGDQCALCDPKYPKPCSGNGKCTGKADSNGDNTDSDSMAMTTSNLQATTNGSARFLDGSMDGSQSKGSEFTCVCNTGWQGTHCQTSTDPAKNSAGDDGPSQASSASHSLASISAFAVMLVTLAAFH
ncbi:unnamed protein product [Albugo candida]|uniref:EGF-like domain-containing protein n=1 Tax=Albugo candida TaxID=65357 RepID=A0A024G7P2_9STRA|nr:unnamed protein product [Albugo candida]|eukprot:CCI42331.1 unnamed protein product [Albugo candida]